MSGMRFFMRVRGGVERARIPPLPTEERKKGRIQCAAVECRKSGKWVRFTSTADGLIGYSGTHADSFVSTVNGWI